MLSSSDVANTSEQTILITGATAGLGRRLGARLGAAGARVVVHGRSHERVQQAVDEIRGAGGNADGVVADMAALAQVDRLAEEVRRRYDRLDVLVNNAGIGFGARGSGRELSADGIELRFAVNYLAGYRLTELLVPLLRESAPARVVNVASAGQSPLDLSDPKPEEPYDGTVAYRRSKLAQVMYTFDLAERLRPHGVTVTALHPATFMDTAMVRDAGVVPVSTIEEGVDATLRLVSDPALDGVTGRYFNGTAEARPHKQAYDEAARAQLRALSEKLVHGALSPEDR